MKNNTELKINTKKRNTILAIIAILVVAAGIITGCAVYKNTTDAPTITAEAEEGTTVETTTETVESTTEKTETTTQVTTEKPQVTEATTETTKPETQTTEPTTEAPKPTTTQTTEPTTEAPKPTTEATHTHNYVKVHHDAVTHTVHHDAVTHTVHHDAVTHTETQTTYTTEGCEVYRCGCGYSTSDGSAFSGHFDNCWADTYTMGWEETQVPHTETVTVVDQPAYDETVVDQPAWDETVVDQPAYDEYVCSCGAKK